MPDRRNANYWQDWVNLALAVGLFISPWVVGYDAYPTPLWNSIIVGVLVAVLAAWDAAVHRETAEA